MSMEIAPAIVNALSWTGRLAGAACVAQLALAPVGALAKIAKVADGGFIVQQAVVVPAEQAQAWEMLLQPTKWWDKDHTWSGDAANLSIQARAGGCFCEVLPNATSPRAAPRGTVEHMRVIYVEDPRVLRMVGSLGPMQGDAVTATLTVQLKPADKGTLIMMEYVVGGFLRVPMQQMASGVDAMLGGQIAGLAGKLGGAGIGPTTAPEADEPASDSGPVSEGRGDRPRIVPDLFDLPGGEPDDNGQVNDPEPAPAADSIGNPNLPSGR